MARMLVLSVLFLCMEVRSLALRPSRRGVVAQQLRRLGLGTLSGIVASGSAARPAGALPFFGEAFRPVVGQAGFQTQAGVKYYELAEGGGPQPRWGDTLVCKFTQYVQRSSDDTPQRIEDWGGDTLVFKHGNGRQMEGLEDGVHTMKVGAQRRLLVPARLAYTTGTVGPLPRSTQNLKKLEKALDRMEVTGQIIFDVTLLNAYRDEADRGYYEDEVPDAGSGAVPKSVINSNTDAL